MPYIAGAEPTVRGIHGCNVGMYVSCISIHHGLK